MISKGLDSIAQFKGSASCVASNMDESLERDSRGILYKLITHLFTYFSLDTGSRIEQQVSVAKRGLLSISIQFSVFSVVHLNVS